MLFRPRRWPPFENRERAKFVLQAFSAERVIPLTGPAILPAKGLADRLTALFWRRPRLLLGLLLAPPLLWLGVVYLGSLAALMWQSFYSIDEFSGMVKPEFTLKTYAELLRPANFDVIPVSYTHLTPPTLLPV